VGDPTTVEFTELIKKAEIAVEAGELLAETYFQRSVDLVFKTRIVRVLDALKELHKELNRGEDKS